MGYHVFFYSFLPDFAFIAAGIVRRSGSFAFVGWIFVPMTAAQDIDMASTYAVSAVITDQQAGKNVIVFLVYFNIF